MLLPLLSRASRVRPWGSPAKSTGVGCHFLLRFYWLRPTLTSIPHRACSRKTFGVGGSGIGDSPRARSHGQRWRGRGPGVPQALDAASLSLGFPCLENGEKAARLVALLRCELLPERGAQHTPEPSPGSPPPFGPQPWDPGHSGHPAPAAVGMPSPASSVPACS